MNQDQKLDRILELLGDQKVEGAEKKRSSKWITIKVHYEDYRLLKKWADVRNLSIGDVVHYLVGAND